MFVSLVKILWLNYLNTVTYGTVSAPFLATRILEALADEEKNYFPKAAEVTYNDMYVDDYLSRPCSLQDSQQLQSQLIHILDRGGTELHKCVSKLPGIIARHSYIRIRIQQKFTENFYKNLRKAMETILGSFYFQN